MTSTSDSSTSSYRMRSVLRPSEPGRGQGAGTQHHPHHTGSRSQHQVAPTWGVESAGPGNHVLKLSSKALGSICEGGQEDPGPV